jgi:hypothetical protein
LTTYEVTSADLRAEAAYVAVPPQECVNGCEAQQGDARSKVFCEPHHLLCPRCQTRITKWLRDLPDTYALLPSVIDHGTVPADPGTKHTKRPDPPAPMRLEVIDLLDTRPGFGALGILHSWASVVREERNQPAICTCGHLALGHRSYGAVRCTAKKCHCDAYQAIHPTVTAECQLLVSNLPWIVEQGFAGDLYEEVRVLQRTLTDTVGDYRAKPVGRCAVLVDHPGAPLPVLCGGALVMDKAEPDASKPQRAGVHCVVCGARHEANQELRELGLIVGQMFGDTREQEAS